MTRLHKTSIFLGALTLAMVIFVKPSFACHQATGWCCLGGGHTGSFCCYFENNKLIDCTDDT